MESEIELLEKNGMILGVGLHSWFIAIKIVRHTSLEIRTDIFSKIISQDETICIVADESTTISKHSELVIFLQSEINMAKEPVFFFIDSVEL